MSSLLETLKRNVAAVHESMAEACRVAGRSPGSVQLIAVTKYAPIEWIEGLISLGLDQFGENRPQQLIERQARWPQVQWHLIGHLQRNKAKSVLSATVLIHSVDSLRLAERLSETATGRVPILCEVNVSGEESKDGFPREELLSVWDRLTGLPGIEVRGLMTMAPFSDDPEAARPVFTHLRELRDVLRARAEGRLALPELSMGMSGDYEVAIQEGATLIRVGSRLFEGLE
ncbi:MAG: YggS family pyridoxal phosphate-dependent enzyme [Planctomycetota bacterium]|nr:MAG: YggS family pyridoxal phosphate-dependent enzyme [Planctomycetota bacterium]